jgi:hypothetical protein
MKGGAMENNKATWLVDECRRGCCVFLWVKLGNGRVMTVAFASSNPPNIELSDLSGQHRLKDFDADTFRAWLAGAAAKPRVKAG